LASSPAHRLSDLTSDSVRGRYAEVSYPGGAFARTHPARHAAIAGLFGLAAPPARRAYVLEVGCAQGCNLLPLAAHLPGGRFVGVDFSAQDIARGRELALDAGLTNLEFVCADLRTFSPPSGAFDYVIAHGVLSWVPDDVKSALFALCARALAPHGIAYLSYNTYPGWKQREALRDLMLMRAGHLTPAADRLGTARRTLDMVEAMLAGRGESHARLTRDIIAGMKQKAPGYFYHDDLDGVNDPCYFLQFTAWAAEHGLAYLGDADCATMFPELLPAPVRAAVGELAGDRLMLEQHLDFLHNRTFRASLVVRAGRPQRSDPDPAALRTCAFGAHLRPPVGLPPLTAGTPVRFGAGLPLSFESQDPVVKALFTLLAAAWPQRIAYAELLAAVRELLAQAGVPAVALERDLPARLLDACGRGLADFLQATPLACATTVPPKPKVHPLTRLMAAQNLPVVNTWHETVPLDEIQRALLATLDGTRETFSPGERPHLATFAAAGIIETAT
jgi:SAM-dependent methyltransferase